MNTRHSQDNYQQPILPQQHNNAIIPPTSSSTTGGSTLPVGVSTPVFSTDGVNIVMVLGVSDNLVGVIVGKQGGVIKDIMSVSGAKANVSPKGEFLPGTNLRFVKVVGTQSQVSLIK